MLNETIEQEQNYLKEVLTKLKIVFQDVNENVREASKELQEHKSYLYENKTGMDAAEKASVKQLVNLQAISGEAAVAYKMRLLKLLRSPYFGRIDFKEEGSTKTEPVYVGIHSFFDEEQNQNIIHDWRAPVSSMFYDYETGEASYKAPSGKKKGLIERKRQYRIHDGEMEMMLESDVYIRDEVLQNELSRSADDKMKHIVATIQRDQNAIIRDEKTSVLIIQGAAGSGKTSIALHRIAFILYRFKDSIESKDIMIISPNKVFSDYISNVLPELGEDSIPEMEMETLAKRVIGDKFKFESFFNQVNTLLESPDEDFIKRISFKATSEFYHKLTAYANWLNRERLNEEDIPIRFKTIPKQMIRAKYHALRHFPLSKRPQAMATELLKSVRETFGYDLKTEEKNLIRKKVNKMVGSTNLRSLYEEFYIWLDKPDMFIYSKGKTFEYADLFPLIYLKLLIEGAEPFKQVKHLIIDEMQDYTPVQYAVLSRLFMCNKTILGDANQNVNPYSSTTSESIGRIFDNSQVVKLVKSYRSTLEIIEFSKKVSPHVEVEPVERHGRQPETIHYPSENDELKAIYELTKQFESTDLTTMGIIAKTQKQAENLYTYLSKKQIKGHLLRPESSKLSSGIIITSAHLAKGLEFDHVVIPMVSDENYKSTVDKSMLYIAVTRAMHRLTLTYSGELTALIDT